MLEAERLSMKSEFDKLAAEFAAERERLLEEANKKALASYRRGYMDGIHEAVGEIAETKQTLLSEIYRCERGES